MILDRAHHDLDDFWRTVDFTIYEPAVANGDERLSFSNSDDRLRTSGVVEVKSEPAEEKMETSVKEEEEDLEEFLKTVRKEWWVFVFG